MVGIIIGIIIKVYRNIYYKTLREIGKGRLMDMLLLLTELTNEIPVEDLHDLLTRFKKKYAIEYGMKESMMDISHLMTIKKTMSSRKVMDFMNEIRERREHALIKNKKRWNSIRKDRSVDRALDSILNILHERLKIQAASAKKKANVFQIQQLISRITCEENVLKNREIRKKLESAREKLENDRKMEKLDEVKEELHEVFRELSE